MKVWSSGDGALQGNVWMKLHSGSIEHGSVCAWQGMNKRENSIGFSWQRSVFACK